MKALFLPCFLCLTGFLLSGCGPADQGPPTHRVSGTVLFDGEPLPEGSIIFRAAEGDVGSAAGKITNGSYSFDSTAGSKIVEITARREVPGKFDESNPGEKVPVREQYIPEQYNTESTLEVEVTPDGDNEFPFELTSDGS